MLYNRIAVLRVERGLSRQSLAREVGVNPQTIGFLERGDYTPSLELAFKLSRFFKLPIEAVFSPEPLRPLSEQVYELEAAEGMSTMAANWFRRKAGFRFVSIHSGRLDREEWTNPARLALGQKPPGAAGADAPMGRGVGDRRDDRGGHCSS